MFIMKKFTNDLNSMVDTLKKSNVGFVRCIKPNKSKVKEVYEPQLVLSQLQYTGMLSTLEIQKAGFPARPLKDNFYKEFRNFDVNANNTSELVQSIQNKIPELREASKVANNRLAIHEGTTRVLMREWLHITLLSILEKAAGVAALDIGAMCRAVGKKSKFYEMEKITTAKNTFSSGKNFQVMLRGALCRVEFMRLKNKHLGIPKGDPGPPSDAWKKEQEEKKAAEEARKAALEAEARAAEAAKLQDEDKKKEEEEAAKQAHAKLMEEHDKKMNELKDMFEDLKKQREQRHAEWMKAMQDELNTDDADMAPAAAPAAAPSICDLGSLPAVPKIDETPAQTLQSPEEEEAKEEARKRGFCMSLVG